MPVTINGNGLIGGLADIKVPDGTASAPTISNIDDLNTGIFFPAADTIAFSEGGTEVIRINSSGNVGIGSPPTPAGKLHVADDTSAAIISQRAGGGGAVFLRGSNGTLAAPTANVSSDLLGRIVVEGYDGTAHVAAAQMAAYVDGTPGTNDMPTRLTFSTTADGASGVTERMRIDSAGLITGTGTSLGAWTAYTPTLVNWTIGNGILDAAYCQIGKTVHYRVVLVLGSTTVVNSFPAFSVPLTSANTTHHFVYGCRADDASLGQAYVMSARWASSTSVAIFGTGGAGGAEVTPSATAPFTWANGDVIALSMTYQAA